MGNVIKDIKINMFAERIFFLDFLSNNSQTNNAV